MGKQIFLKDFDNSGKKKRKSTIQTVSVLCPEGAYTNITVEEIREKLDRLREEKT